MIAVRQRGYDYIVVGAGAAGCIVAARLSEDSGAQVLLIEAGSSDNSLLIKIPLLTFMASATPDRNWSFETEPIPALHNRRQVWNQGRVVGGSSSINGMIYLRGHPSEYDAWGCEGWTFRELLPLYKRLESSSRGESEWHGGHGPMAIRPSNLDPPICGAFLEAARAAGYPLIDDINAGESEGFYRYDCNIDGGVRASAARAYLRPARGRENLTIIENTVVLRVLFQGARAIGVETLCNGVRQSIFTDGEVILCGGALNSPTLLLASGIGPADHLREVGVNVVLNAPEVGGNLQNHVAYFLPYYCTAPVTAYRYMSPMAGLGALVDYAFSRTGPLAESFASIGGNIRSDPDADFADMIIGLLPSLMQRASGSTLHWWDLLPKEHGCTVLVGLGRPYSRGKIRLRSNKPGDTPCIYPDYFSDERDMAAVKNAVVQMRRLMRMDEIARYIDSSRGAACQPNDPQAIEESIRATAGTFSHPNGTCRMGPDARAVVDTRLRVNGVEGLRVADNSIIPRALNAFVHAPALLIGEKASAMIREERSGACKATIAEKAA